MKMLAEGETARTSSGRTTTPFPKVDTSTNRKSINTVKRMHEWLYVNAIAEADARGDEFNAKVFQGESPSRLPPATVDAMNEYLFGYQPAVSSPFLKELI